MKVAKWGNSLAIRIPKPVVEALRLKEGDSVEINIANGRSLEVSKKPTRKELIDRLLKYRGRMPADFKFDREEANRRG